MTTNQVREFHEAFDLVAPGVFCQLTTGQVYRRIRLIDEEMQEAMKEFGDVVDGVDGGTERLLKELCDLLYVVYGTFVEMGLDAKPFFDEVHRSNMSKVGGTVDSGGKLVKPKGYTRADIASVLDAVRD